MRGMLEDEMTIKRTEYFREIQKENKKMAIEKRKREERWKEEQTRMDMREILRKDDEESMRSTQSNPFASSMGLYDLYTRKYYNGK